MEVKAESNLLQSFSDGFQLPFTGSIFQWGKEFVDLPTQYAVSGKFDVEISPYLKQPFRDLKDNQVTQINCVGATQTFKTGITEVSIPYWIVNDPGPILKLHQSDDMAKTFTETRLIPLLNKCVPVKWLLAGDRFSAKKTAIILPHMAMKIGGAKENLLHGLSIRYLLLDEAWLYDEGVIEKAIARTTAFAGRRKIFISSQPGTEGDQLSKHFHAGKIFFWGWQCPECKKLQRYYWSHKREDGSYSGVTWDSIKNEDGSTNQQATALTAKFECHYCKHQVEDTDANRVALNRNGDYICTKEDGDITIHSYSWPAFVNTKLKLKELVVKYLQAKKKFEDTGLVDDLRLFHQQVLGEEWKKENAIEPSKIIIESYDPLKEWEDEAYRFLSVDYQRKFGDRYYVIRAWSRTGESRLILHGKVNNWNEIADIQRRHKVATNNVFIDCGYNATEVYGESIKRGSWFPLAKGKKLWVGWQCLKGDRQPIGFKHNDGIVRLYNVEGKGDPNFGQSDTYRGLFARYYAWASTPVKTILIHLRDGKGAKWVTNTKDEQYERQLYSIALENIQTKNGVVSRVIDKGEAHFADCEAMQVVAALMVGIIGDASAPQAEEVTEVEAVN